ncbi:hypothetical protein NC651_003284 [Populus alba x Populus x berolinensis]|nr:hypothetical protein NC651_003284 [Populus alba x Populus x berolinensis]
MVAFLAGPTKTIVSGNHYKYILAMDPKGTVNYSSFLASHCFCHGCAVSVKGDPGQEQVLTFLSNGIPFMTLTFSFHKLGAFFAVPYRFVTVVELEPPA